MLEITHAQKVRLGFFLMISGGILISILVIITGTNLFEQRDDYYIRYRDMSVSGLEIGAQVKYHGVRVGRVDKIYIDPGEVETVIIALSLDEGTPVKDDVKAVIVSLSLAGLKIIELEGGSSEANLLPVGSEIPAGESPLQMITGRAEVVAEKLELVLTNLIVLTGGENQTKFLALVENTTAVLDDVHEMLMENKQPIARTFANLDSASNGIRELAMSPEIRRVFANLDTTAEDIRMAQIGEAVLGLRATLDQVNTTFNHLDLTVLRGRHDLLTSLEVLRESLEFFNEFTRIIAEDPSLLLRGTAGPEIGRGN